MGNGWDCCLALGWGYYWGGGRGWGRYRTVAWGAIGLGFDLGNG